jgi:CBS domain-containing protein
MSLDAGIARGLLRDLRAEAVDAAGLYRRGEGARTSWRSRVFTVVSQALGSDSHIAKDLAAVHYSLFVATDLTPDIAWEQAFVHGIDKALGLIDAADFELSLVEQPVEATGRETLTGDGKPTRPTDEAATGVAPAPRDARAGALMLFHRIANVLPDGQVVVAIPTTTMVGEALQLMLENNYSQLPVVEGSTILGSFSFRSFSRGLLDMPSERVSPLELTVDDYVEKLTIVDPTSDLDSVLGALNADSAVLVGRPDKLVGIVTGVDVLLYVYQVAELFVQLQEIEQAVRTVIRRSATAEEITECISRSLKSLYVGREDKLPTDVLGMSFAEYASLIGDGRNWDLFAVHLGTDRSRVKARLDRVADLRNDVFHFRRDLTEEDRRHLRTTRDWLLRRLQLADIRSDA